MMCLLEATTMMLAVLLTGFKEAMSPAARGKPQTAVVVFPAASGTFPEFATSGNGNLHGRAKILVDGDLFDATMTPPWIAAPTQAGARWQRNVWSAPSRNKSQSKRIWSNQNFAPLG
jgi:hypothetical protein